MNSMNFSECESAWAEPDQEEEEGTEARGERTLLLASQSSGKGH